MRDLFTSLKRLSLGAALGVLFGLLAFGQAAEAAYPWELNFWLSRRRYDGRVAECEHALGTISHQTRAPVLARPTSCRAAIPPATACSATPGWAPYITRSSRMAVLPASAR